MNGIAQARSRNKITQEKIARELSVDRSTVAKWETNKSLPRAELLPRLASLLGCTIDELLRGE